MTCSATLTRPGVSDRGIPFPSCGPVGSKSQGNRRPPVRAVAVSDEGVADVLTGGESLGWFLFNVDGDNGP